MKTIKSICFIIILFCILAMANLAGAQTISFEGHNGEVGKAVCDKAANTCQLSITVTFKGGTSLIADQVKAADIKESPLHLLVDGSEKLRIERSDGDYLLVAGSDSTRSTRLSDIKKAIRDSLREEGN